MRETLTLRSLFCRAVCCARARLLGLILQPQSFKSFIVCDALNVILLSERRRPAACVRILVLRILGTLQSQLLDHQNPSFEVAHEQLGKSVP